MRWICRVSVLLAACGLAWPAAGAEQASGGGTVSAGCGHFHVHQGPTHAGSFCGMTPGCCRCGPSACDNAWDGYCHEKARWQAFWYKVGTGTAFGHGAACQSCQPTPACEPGCQPSPAYRPYYQPAETEPVLTRPVLTQPVVRRLPAPVERVSPARSAQSVESLPLPPMPRPMPEKTTRQSYDPRFR
ncbi:MAG: hypothetical protein JXB62_12065 [Pirellulales bacterium]|nr:hypothetical protein [Pirellulales bacterium]